MKIKLTILILFIAFTPQLKGQDYLYEESYNTLNEMLLDSTKYSFKKAVFSVENAYSNGALDSTYFDFEIKSLAQLVLSVKSSNTLNDYDYPDKKNVENYASLYKVMTDTLQVKFSTKQGVWLPFGYDFNDPFGHTDWNRMFVTKLLKTHKGNCHSLPYLYKILAEEIGENASLSLAPNHIYIKHRNKRDGWYNTELTSGMFPIDAWLVASGYIHIDAIRNGVYMKALTDKESIALCLVDLAQAYQKQEFYDLDFVIKCADKALKYFPNCVNAMILITEAKGKKIENILYGHNTDFTDVNKYPETRKIFLEIQDQLTVIHELGYRQMPEDMYLNWLVSLKEEKAKYENKKINTFNQTPN